MTTTASNPISMLRSSIREHEDTLNDIERRLNEHDYSPYTRNEWLGFRRMYRRTLERLNNNLDTLKLERVEA